MTDRKTKTYTIRINEEQRIWIRDSTKTYTIRINEEQRIWIRDSLAPFEAFTR